MGRIPTFPPNKDWDRRMISEDICPSLTPVKTVHHNPWFTVNNRGGYFTTEMKEAQGVILPIVDRKSIILVRVYRPVIEDETLELPAGGFSLNKESPEKGLNRELAEETGIILEDISRLVPFHQLLFLLIAIQTLYFHLRLILLKKSMIQEKNMIMKSKKYYVFHSVRR